MDIGEPKKVWKVQPEPMVQPQRVIPVERPATEPEPAPSLPPPTAPLVPA